MLPAIPTAPKPGGTATPEDNRQPLKKPPKPSKPSNKPPKPSNKPPKKPPKVGGLDSTEERRIHLAIDEAFGRAKITSCK